MASKLFRPNPPNNGRESRRATGRGILAGMSSDRVPRDLEDAFELHRAPGRTAIVRSDFAAAFETHGLLVSPHGGETARRVDGGRGDARLVSIAPGEDVVVRPGRRGGWPGRLVRARYFLGDRFRDELVLTERLRRRGAPVPEPLAAVRRERRVGYETWLVTRRIEGARPAARALRDTPEPRLRDLLEAAGRGIRRLHEAGGDHADLNAWNVLLVNAEAREPEAWIVDLDRGRLRAPLPARRARAALARLRRSLAKLGLERALDAWDALERGYASAAGGPPGPSADRPAPTS